MKWSLYRYAIVFNSSKVEETLRELREKYSEETANRTNTEWLNGNTSVFSLDNLDSFSDDLLLRILQDLSSEFADLKVSDNHSRSLIVPAFAFSMLAMCLVFCLCSKEKVLDRKQKNFEEKVSEENLEYFKQEVVKLCREEYLARRRKEEKSELKADPFISRPAPPVSETPLRASRLTPMIYIPALAHNRVFDPSEEARPVTAGDIELAWRQKFENDK